MVFNKIIIYRDLGYYKEYAVAALDALLNEKTTKAKRYSTEVDISPKQGLRYFLEDVLGKPATFGSIPYTVGEDSHKLRDDVLHTVGIARLAQELIANRTYEKWQNYLDSHQKNSLYDFGDVAYLSISLLDYRNPQMSTDYDQKNDQLRFTLTDTERIVGKPLTLSEKNKLHDNHNLEPKSLQRVASEIDLADLVGNESIIGSARMYALFNAWRLMEDLDSIVPGKNPDAVATVHTILNNHQVILPYEKIAAYNKQYAQRPERHKW